MGRECGNKVEYAFRRRRARATASGPPPRRADTRLASISPPPEPLRPRLPAPPGRQRAGLEKSRLRSCSTVRSALPPSLPASPSRAASRPWAGTKIAAFCTVAVPPPPAAAERAPFRASRPSGPARDCAGLRGGGLERGPGQFRPPGALPRLRGRGGGGSPGGGAGARGAAPPPAPAAVVSRRKRHVPKGAGAADGAEKRGGELGISLRLLRNAEFAWRSSQGLDHVRSVIPYHAAQRVPNAAGGSGKAFGARQE